jgi:hypothetical protein
MSEVIMSTLSENSNIAASARKGPVSKRRAVKLMRGAVLATALAALSFGRVASSAPCPRNYTKCFGACCSPTQQCVSKGAGSSCQCRRGTFPCNGDCVANSDENCGFCGNTCPDNTTCVNGTCQCSAGFVFCGGRCVSTACGTGEEFDFSTCACQPVQGGCAAEGDLCTSKNECCSPTAKCVPAGGSRKVCHG